MDREFFIWYNDTRPVKLVFIPVKGECLMMISLIRFFTVIFIAAGIQLFAAESAVTVDVCIYGGTPSGLTAAVAAKQEGMNVIIIEPSRWLGGILGAGIKPAQDCPDPKSVGGLTKSKVFKLGKLPPLFRKASVDWMEEENIPVVYEYRVAAVEKEGTVLKSVRIEFAPPDAYGVPAAKTDASNFRNINAKMFIDASYEADLTALAKVDYTVGREPREKFNEKVAGVGLPTCWTPIDPFVEPGKPESGLLKMVDADHGKTVGEGDDYTQAYNYRFYVTKDEAKKIPLGIPEDYDPKDYELLGRYVDYLVKTLGSNESALMKRLADIFPGWMNNGEYNYKRESLFSIAPLGESRFYQDGDWTVRHNVWAWHRNYLRGIHHFLSTDLRVPEKFRKETALYGLDKTMHEDTAGFPNQLYIRICRRMQGETVLDLHDVWNERQHKDSVGLALYGVDTYPVRRYAAKHPETGQLGVATEGNMFIGGNRGTGKPYQISYGVIIPKREQCTNLLVPVCFSASYIAYASARMEPYFCVLGESAGVAAAQAVKENCPLHNIDKTLYRNKLLERGQILEWNHKN
ncbi:MAG: FAD-dependent oxidoreductase [Planctomycetaceae bacterium]|nr:FAD-dependent oxidoreductase [Planctomycetaceae bacterium]